MHFILFWEVYWCLLQIPGLGSNLIISFGKLVHELLCQDSFRAWGTKTYTWNTTLPWVNRYILACKDRTFPAGIYLHNKNTRTACEICSIFFSFPQCDIIQVQSIELYWLLVNQIKEISFIICFDSIPSSVNYLEVSFSGEITLYYLCVIS